MKNTSGYTVFVDVTGGTVTAIAVNTTVTGLTSGSFRLAPGDKIAITYSAAPVVSWTFEGTASSAPTGLWAGAPALAASNVPMVNTSGRAVAVTITGGTWTAVIIDGVTITNHTSTNTPNVRLRVRRGGSIALTYSVAPTLQWMYDN
jgi:hypothetical protein